MPSTSKRNYPELQQICAPASELVLFALGIPDLPRAGAVQGEPFGWSRESVPHRVTAGHAALPCADCSEHDKHHIALDSHALAVGHSSSKSFLCITYLWETSGTWGSRLLQTDLLPLCLGLYADTTKEEGNFP